MDLKEIKNRLHKIEKLLEKGHLKKAIKEQKQIALGINTSFILEKINFELESYNYLLDFFKRGVEDAKRKQLFDNIRINLFIVNDLLLKEASGDYEPYNRYIDVFDELDLEFDLKRIAQKTNHLFNADSLDPVLSEDVLEKFFIKIWLYPEFTEQEVDKFKVFLSSKANWVQKALALSALTMSLLYFFSPTKLLLLFDAIILEEPQVWERAFVGLIIVLSYYDDRLKFYPQIIDRIRLLSQIKGFEHKFRTVIIQLLRSGVETEILQQKFEQEILPEMQRLSPKFTEKLDLENFLSEDMFEEENPDWKKLISEEEDFFNKVSEFSMLQLQGADILHSAFSKMKHFPFFNKISNWFMPFYKDNKAVISMLTSTGISEKDARDFMQILTEARYMCNSDKYSFCYQWQFLPQIQIKSTIELFKMEAKSAKELMDQEQKVDPLGQSKQVIIQYVQDLYRFFKLYPFRENLVDIFGDNINFHKKYFFKLLADKKLYFDIGDFYLGKKLYSQALDVYVYIEDYEKDMELLEKIGFIYQKRKDYKKALEFYKRAELFEQNKKWLQKKIAFCSMKIGDYDSALYYYNNLLNHNPNDKKIILNIANCYLNKEDYEQALQYYYKVNYYSPDEPKVIRALAWINFRLKNLQKAKNFYEKLLQLAPKPADFILAAHVFWLIRDRQEAMKMYKKAYSQYTEPEDFEKEFYEDANLLNEYGISKFEINLIYEAIID